MPRLTGYKTSSLGWQGDLLNRPPGQLVEILIRGGVEQDQAGDIVRVCPGVGAGEKPAPADRRGGVRRSLRRAGRARG